MIWLPQANQRMSMSLRICVIEYYIVFVRKNSSMQFCIFFPIFGAQVVIIIIQLLGINYLGAWYVCG